MISNSVYRRIPEAERETWCECAVRALETAGMPGWLRIKPTVQAAVVRLRRRCDRRAEWPQVADVRIKANPFIVFRIESWAKVVGDGAGWRSPEPLAHGLARHENDPFKPAFLDVMTRGAEAKGAPAHVADDVDQEAVTFVRKPPLEMVYDVKCIAQIRNLCMVVGPAV